MPAVLSRLKMSSKNERRPLIRALFERRKFR